MRLDNGRRDHGGEPRQAKKAHAARRRALLTFLFASLSAPGNVLAAGTQCRQGESVLFSCRIGGNVASVCASGLTTGSGSVQYRFGPPGAPKVRLPSADRDWKKTVTAGVLTLIGGGGAYAAFSSDPYRYVVYTSISHGRDKSGVAVEKNGRRIRDLRCSRNPVSELGPDLFSQHGFAEDGKGFDLP